MTDALNQLANCARSEAIFRAQCWQDYQRMLQEGVKPYEEAVDEALVAANAQGVSIIQMAAAMGTTNRAALRERVRSLTRPFNDDENLADHNEANRVRLAPLQPAVDYELDRSQMELRITASNWGPDSLTGGTLIWYDKDDTGSWFGTVNGVHNDHGEVIDPIGAKLNAGDNFYFTAVSEWLEENA